MLCLQFREIRRRGRGERVALRAWQGRALVSESKTRFDGEVGEEEAVVAPLVDYCCCLLGFEVVVWYCFEERLPRFVRLDGIDSEKMTARLN
jgi:hypothetical protein